MTEQSAQLQLQLTEYQEVLDNVRQCVALLWEAFKTYFAVTPLLGLALLLAAERVPARLMQPLWSVGAFVGLVVSLLGCVGVRRIIEYQRLLLERGAELEVRMGIQGGQLSLSKKSFEKTTARGLDTLTYVALGTFASAWAVLLGLACIGTAALVS